MPPLSDTRKFLDLRYSIPAEPAPWWVPFCRIEMANVAVLPVPDWAMTSQPLIQGMTALLNGVSKPNALEWVLLGHVIEVVRNLVPGAL